MRTDAFLSPRRTRRRNWSGGYEVVLMGLWCERARLSGMRFRNLRVAWSVACVMLCVLTVRYWIRSYSVCDRIHVPVLGSNSVISVVGTISISGRNADPGRGWEMSSTPVSQMMPMIGPGRSWAFGFDQSRIYLVFPHRIFVLIFTVLGAAPWIRWQFSLRSLFVFATLTTVILGAAAYVARRVNS